MYKLILSILISLYLLAGCAHTPCEPRIYTRVKIKTVEKRVPVLIPLPFAVPVPLFIVFKHIHFDTDSYSLSKEARDYLPKLAEFLLQNKNIRLRIEGHADERGKTKYNQRLSDKRAEEVWIALVLAGVPTEMLRTRAYGETQPIDPRPAPEAWKKNRRVEFYVTEIIPEKQAGK